MKVEDYVIVLLVFAGLLTATFTIQGDIGNTYNVALSGEAKVSEITAINEMNTIAKDIESKILGLSEKVSSFDPLAIYDVAGLFLDVGAYILKIPNAMTQSLEIAFSFLKVTIPSWFMNTIFTIIAIMIAFTALKFFLKRGTI